jgi:AcrR family transcriptional regulator
MINQSHSRVEPPAQFYSPAHVERADAAANRERIMSAAEGLFAEHGVAAVNMEMIAAAAGVGKGTLYRRFANKGTLCLALLGCQLDGLQGQVTATLQSMAAANQPVLEQLHWLLRQLLTFHVAHLPLLCEAITEGRGEDTVDPLTAWQHGVVSKLLEAAQARGELTTRIRAPLLADLLLAPLRPPLLRLYLNVRHYTVEELALGLQGLVHQLAAE